MTTETGCARKSLAEKQGRERKEPLPDIARKRRRGRWPRHGRDKLPCPSAGKAAPARPPACHCPMALRYRRRFSGAAAGPAFSAPTGKNLSPLHPSNHAAGCRPISRLAKDRRRFPVSSKNKKRGPRSCWRSRREWRHARSCRRRKLCHNRPSSSIMLRVMKPKAPAAAFNKSGASSAKEARSSPRNRKPVPVGQHLAVACRRNTRVAPVFQFCPQGLQLYLIAFRQQRQLLQPVGNVHTLPVTALRNVVSFP